MEFYISPQSGQFYMINVLENQWLSVTFKRLKCNIATDKGAKIYCLDNFKEMAPPSNQSDKHYKINERQLARTFDVAFALVTEYRSDRFDFIL